MSKISEIIQFNEQFVENKDYEKYLTDGFPNKKIVIVTCMDTRLTVLLPKAMNLKNGDAKFLKTAGATISSPFGSIMRSIIVALYELNADEVAVIGHHGCGMTGLNAGNIMQKMNDRGITKSTMKTLTHSGIDLSRWLTGFDDAHENVEKSTAIIRNHPLLPPNTPVHGMLIHPETGKLDWIINGYDRIAD